MRQPRRHLRDELDQPLARLGPGISIATHAGLSGCDGDNALRPRPTARRRRTAAAVRRPGEGN
jgi:hypothetical protein